jgi:hypothetical protein
MSKPIFRIVLKGVLGVLCFLGALYVGNSLASYLKDPGLYLVLDLLNDNLILILVMSMLFVVGEAVGSTVFPISLAAMPINAAAAVLLLAFLFNVLELVDILAGVAVARSLKSASSMIYALLFIVVLLGSYFKVFKKDQPEEKTN